MDEIRTLPSSGLITVAELAKFLGIRNEKLRTQLKRAGIKVIKISPKVSKQQFVDLKDIGNLAKGEATYKRTWDIRKSESEPKANRTIKYQPKVAKEPKEPTGL